MITACHAEQTQFSTSLSAEEFSTPWALRYTHMIRITWLLWSQISYQLSQQLLPMFHRSSLTGYLTHSTLIELTSLRFLMLNCFKLKSNYHHLMFYSNKIYTLRIFFKINHTFTPTQLRVTYPDRSDQIRRYRSAFRFSILLSSDLGGQLLQAAPLPMDDYLLLLSCVSLLKQ